MALTVRNIREIKLENMMQGASVVFFFNVPSLHLSGTVEEYHKKPTLDQDSPNPNRD